MSGPEARVGAAGISIPDAPAPAGEYVGARLSGRLAFVSGQIALADNGDIATGRVGDDVSIEQARDLCRQATLSCLAQLQRRIGSLDNVSGIVKVTGYVRSAPGFEDQPAVVDGASQLLIEIFGEAGRHARAAIGVAELPRGAPVEVELIAEVVDGLA
ncbi:MAG: Endoribonuclease [Acidimicrobiaceae bacterium]|nr:Endoribonuclease [Acidimicrobiaceae bacterium]